MRVMAVVVAGVTLLLAPAALGLVAHLKPPARVPASAPAATSAPGTEPSTRPKNIDKALEEQASEFVLNGATLETAIQLLLPQVNVVVNWPALELTGIRRDTPVTLRLHNLSREQALRVMLEQLPVTKSKANYRVADNAIEITTTAELGKQAIVKLFDVSTIISDSAGGAVTAEQKAAHGAFLKALVHLELERAGEDVDAAGREIVFREDYLAVTQSRRAQLLAQHTLQMLKTPVRLNEFAPGAMQSVAGKKAEQAMTDLCGKPGKSPTTLEAIARDPAKQAPLNIVLLPSGAAEVGKAAPALDYTVDDAGVVLIGSQAEVRGRVMLAVYDLRELLKRMAFKSKTKPAPGYAELAASVLAQVKAKVPAGREKDAAWGDLEKSPTSMTLYEYLLVVSAPPAAQRGVTGALQDLYR